MNNSSEIFPIVGANSSNGFFFCNCTWEEIGNWKLTSVVDIIVILLGFPLNSYVVWLIATGTGNGLSAELFSLNLSICEILNLKCVFLYLFLKSERLKYVVYVFDGASLTGRALFQSLLCVERYLAVVHPVTFLKYKPLRYRVICSVISGVASVICGGINTTIWILSILYLNLILISAQFLVFLSVQLFCLVGVLRALKQSGPGERKREKEENQMKKQAFYIILITTMTVLISCVFYMIAIILLILHGSINAFFYVSSYFLIISGWMQPLFFLYREGKLPFIGCQ